MTSKPSSQVPSEEAKWWPREPSGWGGGGAAARPERTRRPGPSSPRTARGPQLRKLPAWRLRPGEPGRRFGGGGPRGREQGRHYRPTLPVPRPQPRLAPRPGPPREGRRRGAGGTGRRGGEETEGTGRGRGVGREGSWGRASGPLLSHRALRWEFQMEGHPAPPGASPRGPGRRGRQGQPLT